MCVYSLCVLPDLSLTFEESDGLGKEAVAQFGIKNPNASGSLAIWQEITECVCGVIHNAGTLCSEWYTVHVRDGGKRDSAVLTIRCRVVQSDTVKVPYQ